MFVPLWKLGHLSWQSESAVAVLALIIFLATALLMLLGLLVMWAAGSPAWASEFIKAVAQVMLTVVGAVLGAGAAKK
jgi:hypothetical protein